MSNIEWTTRTWNPMVGCSKISAGCQNCYAIKDAHRLAGNPNPKISSVYAGLTERRGDRTEWTGKVNFVADRLELPLKTRNPTTWFVNSMSDLFHESVTDEQLDQIFAVMAATPRHTYQVLTKRPDRMLEYCSNFTKEQLRRSLSSIDFSYGVSIPLSLPADVCPPRNVWLGVTVENQKAADERIPLLLQTPAAVRFLSCEPLLEDVTIFHDFFSPAECEIDWVIVGGESGHGARLCDIAWMQSVVEQCKEAEVPCFVKQVGSQPIITTWSEECGTIRFPYNVSTGKGGNPEQWPEELQVRQFPKVAIPA